MELTQEQRQGTFWHTERSPKVTINDLPNELLVEIFDFYRQDDRSYQQWSIGFEWFKLIHVCKRWRAVMFASSSRLDLCFVLHPRQGGHMKTIMSRQFPPLPIEIDYWYQVITHKNIGRVVAALKRPDRIRGIILTVTMAELQKLFRAIKCPLPALKSLELCVINKRELKIPAGFFKGSYLQLRSLKLHYICRPSILRLLSLTPALTCLSLGLNTVGTPSIMSSLLSHFQGMPCLRRLDLEIDRHIDNLAQPTTPKENFTLSKLTSFRYYGHSAYLNTLVTGFAAPSLREADIRLYDKTLPSILHLSQFIEDTGQPYHAVKVVLEQYHFRLSLLPLSEYVGEHDSPGFKLCTKRFPESIMQTSRAFSAMFNSAKLFAFCSRIDVSEEAIPWRRLLLQISSVKTLLLRLGLLDSGSIFRIASALHQDHGRPNLVLMPALEEIELGLGSDWTYRPAPELEAFQPLVSARQQAGLPPVRVFYGPRRLSALS